jgi:hypothetical protein
MDVEIKNFSESEVLHIRQSDHYAACQKYGQMTKAQSHRVLERVRSDGNDVETAITRAAHSLQYMRSLVSDSAFTVGGVNRLKRYFECFDGFADGANLTVGECASLQSEQIFGCQTLFVQDKETEHIGFFHIEENLDDPGLYRFCLPSTERDVASISEPIFDYRMVMMNIGRDAYTYFGYPGLCFGGPSMGVNQSAGTFISVDFLSTMTPESSDRLWVNALVSMVFDIGSIDEITGFINQVSRRGIRLFQGYAIHAATGGEHPRLLSFECGDTVYDIRMPFDAGDRRIIAHGNIPENEVLYSADKMNLMSFPTDDLLTIQYSIESHRREERLRERARLLPLQNVRNTVDTLQSFTRECAEPFGDIETNEYGKEFTGYVTPLTAGFSVGSLGKAQSVVRFHKLHPEPLPDRPYRFWYDEHEENTQDVGIDLLASARAYSALHPIHV